MTSENQNMTFVLSTVLSMVLPYPLLPKIHFLKRLALGLEG